MNHRHPHESRTVTVATRLRAVICEIATAAYAYHLLYHGSINCAQIDTQNFCVAAQLMIESFDIEGAEDLRKLLQAGIAALSIDACAAGGNVNSALAHARRVLTECAQAGVA